MEIANFARLTSRMKFIPYENYNLQSSLTPEEISVKIIEMADKPPSRIFYKNGVVPKNYSVLENKTNFLKIRKNISLKNFHPPVVCINLSYTEGESKIQISMMPPKFAIVFLSVWSAGIMFIILDILFTIFKQNNFNEFAKALSIAVIVPILMLVFMVLFNSRRFRREIDVSKKDIAKALEQ